MTKKTKTYYDKFIESLTSQQLREFEEEHREFLLSEMQLAAMHEDNVSVRRLTEFSGVSLD